MVYKTRTVLDPSQNLLLAMYVMSLCHTHWHLWVILFLAIMYFTEYHSAWMLIDGTQTSVSFNHCLHIPITESVNEMSMCALRWFYYHSQNRQCISWTATEQPSLHDDRTQNPCQVVEISNHLATFFIESKPMTIYTWSLADILWGTLYLCKYFKKYYN